MGTKFEYFLPDNSQIPAADAHKYRDVRKVPVRRTRFPSVTFNQLAAASHFCCFYMLENKKLTAYDALALHGELLYAIGQAPKPSVLSESIVSHFVLRAARAANVKLPARAVKMFWNESINISNAE